MAELPAVEVKNVDMHFKMSKERLQSLKELFLKFVKRDLKYENFVALNNVSLTIEKGDVFGIVGLNGSGKSTLLKIISGILTPTHGEVVTRGVIAPLIELGAGFDLELTARENIYLNGSVLGFSEANGSVFGQVGRVWDRAKIGVWLDGIVPWYLGIFKKLFLLFLG